MPVPLPRVPIYKCIFYKNNKNNKKIPISVIQKDFAEDDSDSVQVGICWGEIPFCRVVLSPTFDFGRSRK